MRCTPQRSMPRRLRRELLANALVFAFPTPAQRAMQHDEPETESLMTTSGISATSPHLNPSAQTIPNVRHPVPERGGVVPTPPPLPTRVAAAAGPTAPRATLPAAIHREPASGEQALDAHELPLAGYLLAKASVGSRVDDPDTIHALRSGQQALADGIGALHRGRGNVAQDIVASEGDSYVAVQVERDAVEFLKSAARYQPNPRSRRTPPLPGR